MATKDKGISIPKKGVGGRPKKDPAEKLEQFSIRLPPKLKYALDLLARAQHRSQSQAVEWALTVGFNNYEVAVTNEGYETIGSLVDRAWSFDRESDRLIEIYRIAPSLLPFEDFKVCELVDRSYEGTLHFDGGLEIVPTSLHSSKSLMAELQEIRRALYQYRETAFRDFVARYWDDLRAKAVDLANAGKNTQGQRLTYLLDLFHNPRVDKAAELRALADIEAGAGQARFIELCKAAEDAITGYTVGYSAAIYHFMNPEKQE